MELPIKDNYLITFLINYLKDSQLLPGTLAISHTLILF